VEASSLHFLLKASGEATPQISFEREASIITFLKREPPLLFDEDRVSRPHLHNIILASSP
jgi:hypothetical protein